MTTPTVDDRIRERLAPLFAELEADALRLAARRAKADPERHRLSRVFEGPMRWRYWRSKDGRGTTVRYCYSTVKNVAGYFLVWREKRFKDGRVVRDHWRAVDKRTDAGRLAKAMREEAG